MNKKLAITLATPLLVVSSYQLQAADWTDKVKLNGFANAIYQKTDESVALHGASGEGGIDDRGNFTGSSAGFNITAEINERVTLYTQMQGTHENRYAMHLDWAFIDIELSESFSLRAGNIKFPVGLVNEYIDVGYLYPWLQAPRVIYSDKVPNGPQAVRDSYSGASLLYSESYGDWVLGADLYAGEVKMESADVRETKGLTLRADWNDQVQVQASTYNGLMENATTLTQMNGKKHEVTTVGVKGDINNIVFYSEHANVKMGTLANMKAQTWYVSVGYRIGKWLPIVTYEDFEQGMSTATPQQQNFTTLGVRYELMPNTALKAEYSSIKTDAGAGMFDSVPSSNSSNRFGLGLSVMF